MGAFREFTSSLWIQASRGKFLQVMFLLTCGITFLGRKIKYEILKPVNCRKCGYKTKVYFLRSAFIIYGFGDDEDLYDWLICQDENCATATKLGGNDE